MSTTSSANTPVSGATGNPKPVNGFLTPTTPAARTPSEKTGGPPIKGLYSNTPNRKFGTPLTGNGTARPHLSTPQNTTPQLSFGATPNAFKELDVTDGGCHDVNTWVTIFGFPPSAASYILSQFSQCKLKFFCASLSSFDLLFALWRIFWLFRAVYTTNFLNIFELLLKPWISVFYIYVIHF